MATPVEIEVLLWHYYRGDDYPAPYSPAVHTAMENFKDMGLIVYAHEGPHPDARTYKLSEGGEMYVRALMDVPLPRQVTKWVME